MDRKIILHSAFGIDSVGFGKLFGIRKHEKRYERLKFF